MKKVIYNLLKFPPGYVPSNKMLDHVGLDFDDDLGGLQKGPRIKRPSLHPAWWLGALSIPLLLIAINPAYGWGFVCGAVCGVTGMLIRLSAHA